MSYFSWERDLNNWAQSSVHSYENDCGKWASSCIWNFTLAERRRLAAPSVKQAANSLDGGVGANNDPEREEDTVQNLGASGRSTSLEVKHGRVDEAEWDAVWGRVYGQQVPNSLLAVNSPGK